ncbi:MAG: DEAD/DEAH box helicase [Muribaculaceae bacterium]|nr:DEAD/DEAH box helicase [Muribaculaceae bacterium]
MSTINHPPLRDYQSEILSSLTEVWKKFRHVMVQMPTGTGKTHLMAAVIKAYAERGSVLIVAHRMELIEQISSTLQRFDIEHGLIVRNAGREQPCRLVMVASIQTLAKRIDSIDFNPGLVVVDEAHHALAKTYRMLWDRWESAQFLGLTATPCRMNGKPFTDLFDTLISSWSIAEFIDKGWLSDFEYVSVNPDSKVMRQIAALEKRGADGDYQTKEMATVMDCPESVSHLYESYRHFADGKKGIVYAIDRTHAAHIAEFYSGHGVSCCVIDGKTPVRERARLVGEYRSGNISILVSVDCFSEGFDCPEVEFIQLARPTLSLSKYLQQVGRGMRIGKGKSHVLILDQVGLYQTFGLPTDYRDWERMFLGQLDGKGCSGTSRGVVLRDCNSDKALVNLEMVRIKRRGELHEGLEVFIQSGKYGVMMDGNVTCRAVFENMERIDTPYFLMATYPYHVFHSRKTIIDCRGVDLQANLYGAVNRHGDFFKAYDLNGNVVYWDAVGGRYYPSLPEIVYVGRFEMARIGNKYMLRKLTAGLNFECTKEDIYIGRQLTVMRDMLIVKHDLRNPYRIYGYMNDGVLVGNRTNTYMGSYMLMRDDGFILRYYLNLPWDIADKPNMKQTQLRRFE